MEKMNSSGKGLSRKNWFVVGLLAVVVIAAPMAHAQATWTDHAAGLMWAKQDNGGDVTWNEARDYCSTLRLAGHSNWRLPTTDELMGIYDQTQVVAGEFVLKGGIKLHYSYWSDSGVVNASGEAWHRRVDFSLLPERDERDEAIQLGIGADAGALCVRRSQK